MKLSDDRYEEFSETMKAYEFPAQVTPEGTLALPSEVLTHLSSPQVVRVIVLVNEASVNEASGDEAMRNESTDLAEADWVKLTAEQFLAGYSASDSIYDTL
jgi:hypothetical protein